MLIFRVCFLVTISLIVTSCVTDGAAEAGGSIYYKTQAEADAALAAFDRDNPSCQLWTNWQKMCSRTGPDGETYCVTDPDRPVKPSEPFCSGYRYAHAYYEFNAAQQASHLRFCKETRVETLVSGRGLSRPGRNICISFSENRPFNGRRLIARLHPYCKSWSESQNDKKVCSTENSILRDVPQCPSLAKRKYSSESILYCSEWEPNLPCAAHSGHDRMTPEPGEILTSPNRTPDFNPVFGIMCQN